ncbi:MAG TPA: hypothetical protein VGZ01_01800 [Trinickia sp.]|jgi:hypothetical protein|nr:hypothetical protein [Trinickia sp.]
MKRPARLTMSMVLVASSVSLAAALVRPAAAGPAAAAQAKPAGSPYLPVSLTRHAKQYYGMMRGVDNLSVRRTASGNLIRFSYRVTDPVAAQVLVDKRAPAYLYAEASHTVLEVPVMDKIGQLRQTGQLEVGQAYWMVFSNKGNPIKAGDRVSVWVGTYHIDGLLVE